MATPRLDSLLLPASDGGDLHVDIRTGGRPGEVRPAVVICHGFKGFKDWGFFPKLAERLAVAGFTVASFNFSGSGVAEGDQFTELDRWARQRPTLDLRDVGVVVDHLAGMGAAWFGLVGHSRGGGLAVLHAARDARIRALVTWASIDHFLRWSSREIARWRREGTIDVVNSRTGQVLTLNRDTLDDIETHPDVLDVLGAAARIRVPWLIVHGEEDPAVPVSVGRALRAASTAARTELVALPGADHTFGVRHPWAGSTPAFDIVLDLTVRWLATALSEG